MIDQNRDGFIDRDDLHDMLASLGKGIYFKIGHFIDMHAASRIISILFQNLILSSLLWKSTGNESFLWEKLDE